MAEYTSLQEYKEYIRPSVGSCLDCIKNINNIGVTSGDIHYSVINDKCPKSSDEGNVLFRITDNVTNVVVEFRMYNSGTDPLNNDALSKIICDLDLNPNGSAIGIYGRLGTSKKATWTCKTVRIENNIETVIFTGDGSLRVAGVGDFGFKSGVGTIGLSALFGYTPTSNTLTFDSFSQRVYVLLKTSDTSTALSNPRYGIINTSYNYISYLRDLNALDHLIEGVYEEEEGKYNYHTYYFYNKTYETNGTRIRSIKGEYKGDGRICGYIGNDSPYNIILVCKGTLQELINDETEWHAPTLPRLTSNDTLNGYYGLLDTNIPLFGSLSDTDNYLNNGDLDGALNEADIDKTSKTGMDGTEARFERANTYDPQIYAGHKVMDVTSVNNDIIAWMNSLNDPDLIDSVKMFWWNDNPINCLTAYYWTPIDIEEVGRVVALDEGIVKFGGIVAKNINTEETITATPLKLQGGEHLLGQYQFNRKYNDWRDYQLFNYKLYLPFHGLVDLEPHYVVGKRMEVKYVYYPTNHTLRYMIFVKKNLYKAIDVSIGIDLGLTSADNVGKAQEITETAFNTLERVATGNVGGAISGVISSGLDLFKKPKTSVWGSTNPTTNIGDPTQALLYIEEQQTIIPNNLYNTYGHANYYIGNIGALSGYCEFSDVRLTGCGTLSDNEKEELKSLLMKGVIL